MGDHCCCCFARTSRLYQTISQYIEVPSSLLSCAHVPDVIQAHRVDSQSRACCPSLAPVVSTRSRARIVVYRHPRRKPKKLA